jgi:cytochrome c oxidase assembly protein subunit 15
MALTVILAGGFVRISEAGESCPDWPTCFGTFGFDVSEEEQGAWYSETGEYDSRGMDHRYTTFEIFTEWFHRLLATMSGAVVLLGVFLVRRGRGGRGRNDLSDENWRAALASLALVLTQGLLGAITVRYDNVSWTVVLHLLFAILYTSCLFWWWIVWRRDVGSLPSWAKTSPEVVGSQEWRLALMTGATLPVILLGVWVSTGGGGSFNQGCGVGWMQGWPLCQGALMPAGLDNQAVQAAWVHRLAVLIVGVFLVKGFLQFRGETAGSAKPLEVMFGLGVLAYLLNVLAGASYVIMGARAEGFPESISLLHLSLATDSILLLSFALLVCRLNRPDAAVAGGGGVADSDGSDEEQ